MGLLSVLGLSASSFAQEIFWSETGGFGGPQLGAVYTSAFDGTGRTAIASGLNRPIGVDLDVERGHIYWAEDGFGPGTSRIVRANLDGSNPAVLFQESQQGFTNAQMLALDLKNGHVYWTDYFLGVIRGKLDGTGFAVLGGHPTAVQYTALDLDLVNGHIYFGDPTQNGVLYRMNLNGTQAVELARPMAADGWRFNSISVDAANGHIYYTDAGTHQIKRMDLDGGNQTMLSSDPGLNPYGITRRPDGRLFWVGGVGRRLGSSAADGSDPQRSLVETVSSSGFGIAVMPGSASALRITGITVSGTTATISWEGGSAPYQLRKSATLAPGSWEDVGPPTALRQAIEPAAGQRMFYRVESN